MIRDFLKRTAKKAAIRAFGMEWEAADTEQVQHTPSAPRPYDPSVIPRLVDGNGDTPGPNHRTNMGRTWVSAQVISGTPPFLIDLRPPEECAAGMLLGALHLPGDQVKRRTELLPDKTTRIIVYDQLSRDEAEGIAEWLRESGWVGARKLVGGYAEWIEHAEPVEVPNLPANGRFMVGTMVQVAATGVRGWVQEAKSGAGGASYVVLCADGSTLGPIADGELSA